MSFDQRAVISSSYASILLTAVLCITYGNSSLLSLLQESQQDDELMLKL